MPLNLDYKGNKGFRLLSMYESFSKGEDLSKSDLAAIYGVSEKTIQRDIDDLRAYLSEACQSEGSAEIKYDKSKNAYRLVRLEREWLTNKEVLALCKILMESRAFCKEELDILIKKLLIQSSPKDRDQIKSMIINEQHYYVQLKHGKHLLSVLWNLSQFITSQQIIEFTYTRLDGTAKNRSVKPVSIIFSEYYFYLIAYMADGSKNFPTVFRVDRITDLHCTNQPFTVPYRDKFSDGEFRKRVQFMYPGELRRVQFEFTGPSIEAVIDRLPTAKVLSENEDKYLIEAQVYGNGIDMWLKSQGDRVKVIKNG